MDLFGILQGNIQFFLLIFARITGIFTAAPIFGSRNIPIYVKAGIGVCLTYIMAPILATNQHFTPVMALLPYIVTVIGEYLIGLIFGFASSLVFSAVQMTGSLLDMQIGFGIINILDPQSGQQVPLIGNFKYILAIILFLSINGHHLLISALFASFKLIPLAGAIFNTQSAVIIVDMVIGIFVLAIKISLPILAALMITDIALGILARTMPQMNIFVVGVPGKIAVGISVLALVLPFYIAFMEVGFDGMFRDLYRLLAAFKGNPV